MGNEPEIIDAPEQAEVVSNLDPLKATEKQVMHPDPVINKEVLADMAEASKADEAAGLEPEGATPTPEEADALITTLGDEDLADDNADMVRTIRRLVEEADEGCKSIPFLDDCVKEIIKERDNYKVMSKSNEKRILAAGLVQAAAAKDPALAGKDIDLQASGIIESRQQLLLDVADLRVKLDKAERKVLLQAAARVVKKKPAKKPTKKAKKRT